MKSYDIAMIGHITRDRIIYPDNSISNSYGGAVLYASAAAVNSMASVLVVTMAAAEDREKIKWLLDSRVNVSFVDSDRTTAMELRYMAQDQEKREIRLVSRAPSFAAEHVPGISATIYQLSGLLHGEIPSGLIASLSRRGAIAFDVQGVSRHSQDGKLVLEDWVDKEIFLPHIYYLKTDAAEAEILTGTDDWSKAAEILYTMGAKEVMVTHNQGVTVYAEGRCLSVPFTAEHLRGRTGRGDTCFAAYVAWRLNHSIEESVVYAASLTSLKMETAGAFKNTYIDVIANIERNYKNTTASCSKRARQWLFSRSE